MYRHLFAADLKYWTAYTEIELDTLFYKMKAPGRCLSYNLLRGGRWTIVIITGYISRIMYLKTSKSDQKTSQQAKRQYCLARASLSNRIDPDRRRPG